jgi:DNA helicase-2/ATP-dependent DNA helicase PcrA
VAVHGPVRILAGAGTGKTRTITHRTAYALASGEVPASAVLTVTFTRRAAGELRDRLRHLGVPPVQASTFHAAALRQLGYFWPRVHGEALPPLLDRRLPTVARAATRVLRRSLPPGQLSDITSEVDWAKASLVPAARYAQAARRTRREAPLEPDTIADIFDAYEALKGDQLDFDDLLTRAAQLLWEDEGVGSEFRARYRWFSIDEYQDTSPAQQQLLEAWLGDQAAGSPELCVVGDVSQTIYTFAGADADHLLDFERRYPDAATVRLVRDYRSTPQVVDVANRVLDAARGPSARLAIRLVGQRPAGPSPRLEQYASDEDEASAVAERVAALLGQGIPAREIAVLVRTNARAEVYEEALDSLSIPYVLRGATWFFDRPEVRSVLGQLRRRALTEHGERPAQEAVGTLLAGLGHGDEPPRGETARQRWESIDSLARMAAGEDAADLTLREWVALMTARAAAGHSPADDAVTVATLHAAKGLEWDAVFVVGVSEGRLPIRFAETPAEIEEERRLFYVGVTRAREHLWVSWARTPSRFLDGLRPREVVGRTSPRAGGGSRRSRGPGRAGHPGTAGSTPAVPLTESQKALLDQLREWRLTVSRAANTPAFTVFTDATLAGIATSRPTTVPALLAVKGVGPAKAERYGDAVLDIVASSG